MTGAESSALQELARRSFGDIRLQKQYARQLDDIQVLLREAITIVSTPNHSADTKNDGLIRLLDQIQLVVNRGDS